jgi:hypothetical protein
MSWSFSVGLRDLQLVVRPAALDAHAHADQLRDRVGIQLHVLGLLRVEHQARAAAHVVKPLLIASTG